MDTKTWEQIEEIARRVGLDPQLWEGQAVGGCNNNRDRDEVYFSEFQADYGLRGGEGI